MKKTNDSIFPFAERAYVKRILSKDEILMNFLAFRLNFSEKRYTASDTPLSYRQLNSLGGNKILKNDRKNQKGWRKFSLRELVFLSVVEEVRKYGIKDNQLKHLRDAFFRQENKFDLDLAIVASISGVKIVVVMNDDGKVRFHDILTIDLPEHRTSKSFINVNFNAIIAKLWEKEDKKIIEYKSLANILGHELGKHTLEDKEVKIINAVRTGKYESVKLKFKGGEVNLLEKTENVDVKRKIVELKKEHGFQSISAEQENGKIVSLKRTSKEKL